MNTSDALSEIDAALQSGRAIPYLGPRVLALTSPCPVPASPAELVARITDKVTVPHKIRNNLTAAAQYIENFKHRKTLTGLMAEAYAASPEPSALQRYLASLPLPLIVDTWYDGSLQAAFAARRDWGQIQGVSQAEHFGTWVQYYHADGSPAHAQDAEQWGTVLYKPLGSIIPDKNFIVSDSDYVEVLTEIDIQTPIPNVVQRLRGGRHFLFLGCRFITQLERAYARQVMKRSSDRHWALITGDVTRNEARFIAEQNIQRIDLPLEVLMARYPAAA